MTEHATLLHFLFSKSDNFSFLNLWSRDSQDFGNLLISTLFAYDKVTNPLFYVSEDLKRF